MNKKLLAVLSLLAISTPSFAAYEEIQCSTDKAFQENSCNQCFDWGSKVQGDNLGLLSDLWKNTTDASKILYKEEQKDPYMVNLDNTNVTWTQTPSADKFWEYTDEFNALYSEKDFGYILAPGKSSTWLKSSLASAYTLEKNTAKSWQNIGMLIYPITTHNILAWGEVSMDSSNAHLECVLFKSGDAKAPEVVIPTAPKKLPQTWPGEFMMLIVIAMISGFWILKFKTKS